MNKTKITGVCLAVAFLCGCIGPTFAPMGRDEFMVEHRGTAVSSVSSLKIKCLLDANAYCEKHGLAMVPVSTEGHEKTAWATASCELVFLAIPPNDPRNKTPFLERSPDSVKVIKEEIKTSN